MRLVISSIQQKLKEGTIQDIQHVFSKDQLADALTKKGASNFSLLNTLEKGYIEDNSQTIYKL